MLLTTVNIDTEQDDQDQCDSNTRGNADDGAGGEPAGLARDGDGGKRGLDVQIRRRLVGIDGQQAHPVSYTHLRAHET